MIHCQFTHSNVTAQSRVSCHWWDSNKFVDSTMKMNQWAALGVPPYTWPISLKVFIIISNPSNPSCLTSFIQHDWQFALQSFYGQKWHDYRNMNMNIIQADYSLFLIICICRSFVLLLIQWFYLKGTTLILMQYSSSVCSHHSVFWLIVRPKTLWDWLHVRNINLQSPLNNCGN